MLIEGRGVRTGGVQKHHPMYALERATVAAPLSSGSADKKGDSRVSEAGKKDGSR